MKGIGGLIEIITGILFFLKRETIRAVILSIPDRFSENSGHYTVDYLIKQANNFSLSTQYFIIIYILFHGVVNIFLVISLLKGKLWAYPTAIIFFSLFIIYQFYRSILHHSGFLFFVSVFDIFLVILTWLEYKRLENKRRYSRRLKLSNY